MIPAKLQCHLKERTSAQERVRSIPFIAIAGIRTLALLYSRFRSLFLIQLFSSKLSYAIITPHMRSRAVILKWCRLVCIR